MVPDPQDNSDAGTQRAPTAIEVIFYVVGGAVSLSLLVVGIRSRTVDDFVRYSSNIALVLVPLVIVGLIAAWFDGGKKRPTLQSVGAFLAGVVVAVPLYSAMLYALFAGIVETAGYSYAQWQSLNLGRIATTLTATLVVVALGSGLFYFRLRLRSCYGSTEALAGVLIAVYKASGGNSLVDLAKDLDLVVALLTAGVYLIVRGLDNVYVGLTDAKWRDPVATLAWQWFKAKVAPE